VKKWKGCCQGTKRGLVNYGRRVPAGVWRAWCDLYQFGHHSYFPHLCLSVAFHCLPLFGLHKPILRVLYHVHMYTCVHDKVHMHVLYHVHVYVYRCYPVVGRLVYLYHVCYQPLCSPDVFPPVPGTRGLATTWLRTHAAIDCITRVHRCAWPATSAQWRFLGFLETGQTLLAINFYRQRSATCAHWSLVVRIQGDICNDFVYTTVQHTCMAQIQSLEARFSNFFWGGMPPDLPT